ncbi:MAG: hypothetical protein H0T73_13030 [Ardenticatenales bacterium]|nr:hypothetical protein [Ardenticatenales bacterium]
MTLISLDGSQFSDSDSYILGALTLAAATGQAFEMDEVGKLAAVPGVSPLHLTAMRALAALCGAEMKGETLRAKKVRFAPSHEPRARDLLIDTGEATGRPSPISVTPLIQALIPVLAHASDEGLIRLRGANATPQHPSVFWLRETLAPMLAWVGIEAGIEIEKWGWYPDGGGESTLLVEGNLGNAALPIPLVWEERGDLVGMWGLAALSPRLDERVGQQMLGTLARELGKEAMEPVITEVMRVRSPGPGSGLFLSMQFEQVTAGFEAVSHQGMSAEQVAREATDAMSHYFWSDAAFDPELATALMIPAALSGRSVTFTTSELTLPMRVLEFLITRFLPVKVSLTKHPAGGQVQIAPP